MCSCNNVNSSTILKQSVEKDDGMNFDEEVRSMTAVIYVIVCDNSRY